MLNTLTELAQYFGMSLREFLPFWKTLSETEQVEWRNASLR